MRRRAGIVLVLAPLLVVAACRGPQARTLPPPSSTSSTEPGSTTTEPDHSRIALEPVPGQTTTTAPMAVGSSTLLGAVQGPDGPVPEAIVRAERLVGDAVQRIDVRTGEDGTFTVADVPGGRFRVRAFLPPTLTMESPEVFFLADGDARELRLLVQEHTGLTVRAGTSPASPVVGGGVNLAVRVGERTVDEDGIAREVPVADVPVRVSATGWTPVDDGDEAEDVEDDPPAPGRDVDDGAVRTDGSGVAVFSFRCDRVTDVTATAMVGPDRQSFPLDPPPCRPVPTTTSTTSTTAGPADPTSTTSTTAG